MTSKLLIASESAASSLGSGLASLHRALDIAWDARYFPEDNLMVEFFSAANWIAKKGLNIPDELLKLSFAFAPIYSKLPRQLIHRDVQPRNLFFEKDKLSAFMDFDSCTREVRIFDLVYLCLTILHDLSHDNDDVMRQWLCFLSTLLRGYSSQGNLTMCEYDSLDQLILILQICFLKFYGDIELDFHLHVLHRLWEERHFFSI